MSYIPPKFQAKIKEAKEKQLKKLDLSNRFRASDAEKLTAISAEIFEMQQLESLDLSGNKITEIPEEIARLENLKSLNLMGNRLTEIPELIANLPNLVFLGLRWKPSETLPTWINQIQEVGIDLSENKLITLPESITKLSNLTQLYLSGNQITTLPESISKLSNLTQLDLSDNQITTLPESITKLSNLTQLDLSDNQITTLPESITKLSNLTQLVLSLNELKSLPEYITKLSNLTQLDLSFNRLKSLPESITKLSNLTQLDLGENRLTTLPESITKLSNLTQLVLSRNELTTLPESITKLVNLTQLDLWGNELKSLPELITKLSNLTQLVLGANELKSLPESITKLSNLTQLDLLRNQLTSLPESITKLSNLTQLDLGENQLISLPESITKLSNLTQLDLSENPLKTPPLEIAQKGIEAIRDYFRELKEGEDYLYEAKLLIVGEGESGKTTLMKKIFDSDYPVPSPETSTEGIDVQEYHFSLENKQDFRVNIWDFGGQEIYHATHQFFLTKRSLYLLVADSRKEQPHLDYWLNVVALLSDNSPLLIIKNEKQNRPVNLDESQIKAGFNNIKDIFPTNLADNRGLEDIIKGFKYRIQQLPHIGTTLPKSWTKVRKALEEDKRNFISLNEYYRICESNSFTSNISPSQKSTNKSSNNQQQAKDRRLILSQYLHDIGVILHFQDDRKSLLYKTIILKPEWGTDAVYKVLDNDTVKRNLGRFTDADINQIWRDEQYNNMQGELLELMIKFKLAYPLLNANDTYIAPQLLNPNSPLYHWNSDNNLLLRYQYDFMPKGILSRFIVELHRHIDEPNVWRTGVILNGDNTKAEVIETYDRREIRIRLSGRNKRGLLEIIMDKLDEIHASFNFNERLQVRKLIPCNCAVCKDKSEPTFYNYRELRERLNHNKQDIECESPPYNTVNILSLIDDVIGREKFRKQQEEDKYSQTINYNFYDEIDNLDIQTNQARSNIMENPNNKPVKVKSSWANGSFYLFTFVVVVGGIGYLGGNLPLIPFAFVIVAGVLFIPIIGGFQLRQDDRLSEKTFLELMKMVIGQLPLIGNMLGNILNPKEKDNE